MLGDVWREYTPSMKEIADTLDRLRKVLQHPWAHKDPDELDSLVGESSSVNSKHGEF